VSSDCYFLGIEDAQVACQRIVQLVSRILPARFGFSPREDIQVLTPMQKGDLGARHLNVMLQQALNPVGPSVERFGWVFRAGDRVMQMENNYDKDVFNGDVGLVHAVDEVGRELTVIFDDRKVVYDFQELDELSLSCAVTIHKSQGSEYPCVVVPVHTQHFVLLQRNLLYTALTRGKKMVVIIGARRALGMAVHRADAGRRITTLKVRVQRACTAE
jgi:exodeoxyribonuclease V alpha subunit